jgi:DNA-binding MarR family transcriptional regulator
MNHNCPEEAHELVKAFSQFRKTHWRPSHAKELKPSEFMVVHTIHLALEKEGMDSLMISEISERLKIAPPTVTQLVNGLKRKGHVLKKKDPGDGRVTRVALTNKGLMLAERAAKEFYLKFNELSRHLGRSKSLQLAELLNEASSFFAGKNKND